MAAIIDVSQLPRLRRRATLLHATMGGHAPTVGIPGALPADLEGDFSDPESPLPHTVPADPKAPFEARGISSDTPVIIYDEQGGVPAARVWWLAKVAGLTNAAVLDGGLQAWLDSGREPGELADLSSVEKPGSIDAAPEWERLVDAQGVKSALGEYNHVVVDVRPPAVFRGDGPAHPALRSGHIPGSVNLPLGEFYTSPGYFKGFDELRDTLEPVAGPAGAIVFTCGSGVSACVGALAANVAGYGDVQVYEGSWSEWGHRSQDEAEFPVETGPAA